MHMQPYSIKYMILVIIRILFMLIECEKIIKLVKINIIIIIICIYYIWIIIYLYIYIDKVFIFINDIKKKL